MKPEGAERPLILVAEARGYSPRALARLQELGRVRTGDLDGAALRREIADAAVLVVRLRHRVDDEVLAGAPGLRAVVSPTTGLDHIDLDACAARNVAVLSLRGEVEFLQTITATAELTWGLLLALVRRLPQASAAARSGVWDRDRFRGRELASRRLGVVGLGRLGRMVARYGQAFRMEVAAFDPYAGVWPDGVRRASTLLELAAASDVLSIHVPLSAGTRGLVDAEVLAALPDGAVLVNTSRGEVVDEDALLEALRSGRLAGAALDVVRGETEDGGAARSPVVAYAAEHDHLLLTPHIGGATLESMENTEIFMAEKLARWLAGVPVRVDAGPVAAGLPGSPADTP